MDYKVMAKNWVDNNLNIPKIKSLAIESIYDCMNCGIDRDEAYDAYIADLVSGSYGWRQGQKVAEMFGLIEEGIEENSDELLYIWDEIERFSNYVSDYLDSITDMKGNFYFGNLDADGAYGLFYSLDKNLVEYDERLDEFIVG